MTADFPPDTERTNATRQTGNEAAFARLEQEMATMKDMRGGASEQISDAASDIGSVGQEQATRGLRHARANMGSMVNDASDRLGVVANRAQSQADTLEDPSRKQQLVTLALAVGLGFLAGLYVARVARSGSSKKRAF